MAILVSEQLSPALEGVIAFHQPHQNKELTDIFIYCTNDVSRSSEPAKRLKYCLSQLLNNSNIKIHKPDKTENGTNPYLVYKAINHWAEQLKNKKSISELIINATGGLKTMFTGVLPFLKKPENRVVYRDFSGWYEIERTASDLYDSKLLEVSDKVRNGRMKITGIKNLINLQMDFPDLGIEDPRKMDALSNLTQVIDKQWNWKSIAIEKESAGIAFEHWFSNVIKLLNVDEVKMGIKSKIKGEIQLETDIWVLNNAQLYFFDLKLTNNKTEKSSLVEQITNASAVAQQLAGLGVKTILIRPGYTQKNNVFKNETAKRFGCEIWMQEDMENLLNKFQTLFNINDEIDLGLRFFEEIQRGKDKFGYVFSNPTSETQMAVKKAKGLIDLNITFTTLDAGIKWLGFKLNDGQCIFQIAERDAYHIDSWLEHLTSAGCVCKRYGNQQIGIKAKTEKAKQFLKKHRSQYNTNTLFKF